MPTILELFRGSDFDKAVDSKAKEGKGTLFAQIKSFGEQELTGIRVKSLVEANNPLIYGNESTRIALRSTPDMDKMRTDDGDGGLIGGTITKIRTKVNSTLGVPQTLIPSSYTKINQDITLNDPKLGVQSGYLERIAAIKDGGQGSFIGGLLSGGNPKTIAQQAAGKLLKEAKDTLRDTLFNDSSFKNNLKSRFGKKEPYKEKETKLAPDVYENVEGATYSEKALENKLNESGKSGTYIKYETPESQLAALRVGKGFVQVTGLDPLGNPVKKDGAEGVEIKTKVDSVKFNEENKFSTDKNKLISDKGFTNEDDIINQSGIYKKDLLIDGKSIDDFDFIPLKFRNIVTDETVNFRGTITGLAETVTPSWDAGRFSGNPFSFYTYQSIERNVSFNFTVYPMNSKELLNNWSKIEFLTSLTYPLGYQSDPIGSVRAPIIYFSMGDLYKDKVSFIESLQYTIPDNSNWQLDGTTEQVKKYKSSGAFFGNTNVSVPEVDKGYKLPHLVEIAITLKFLEQRNNTEDRKKLYSFESLTYSDSGGGGTPPITGIV